MRGVWILGLIAVLASCGPLSGDRTATPQLFSLDGVKLLAQNVSVGSDPSTYEQSSYPVSPSQHLLLRFETLKEQVDAVDISSGKKIIVQIAVVDPTQLATALTMLKLCPVTRSWMMLATWSIAHPFGARGQWSQPGGDYDSASCVLGEAAAYQGSSPTVLQYDMTRWFMDYPRGRRVNYGMIVLSERLIQVQGDKSGSYSPRILFDRFNPPPPGPFSGIR